MWALRTHALNLIYCSVLSWLYRRRYGPELVSKALVVQPPQGMEANGIKGALQEEKSDLGSRSQLLSSAKQSPPTQPYPRPCPWIPPRSSASGPAEGSIRRWSRAHILTGLTLGGSAGNEGEDR